MSDLHPDALASGWTRSFKLGEQRYDLEHHPRAMHEIRGAASGAGLTAKFWYDISFGDPELPLFRRSDKDKLFVAAMSVPALFIGLWEKPC